jgi:hypothetical protein
MAFGSTTWDGFRVTLGCPKEVKMLPKSLYCQDVRPVHVERPETESSHVCKGHRFGPFPGLNPACVRVSGHAKHFA